MPITAGVGALVGGGIASSAIGANAAGNAADTQANAANYAAQLQSQNASQALNFQQQQFGQQQQNIAPWLQSGTGALGSLDYLLGVTPQQPTGNFSATGINPPGVNAPPQSAVATPNPQPGQPQQINGRPLQNSTTGRPPIPNANFRVASDLPNTGSNIARVGANGQPITGPGQGPRVVPGAGGTAPTTPGAGSPGGFGSLLQGWNQQFQAPTGATEQNDPGYQFRLNQGEQALQNSAAARGGLLSGNTGEALQQYGQDYASNEYGNVYNRSLGQYQQAYNQFQNNQANQYNRLASLAGIGQTAAGQLGQAGQSAANNISNTLLTSGQQIGQNINNAGAANASGYVGQANAITSGIGNTTNQLGQLLSLQSMLGGGGPTSGTFLVGSGNPNAANQNFIGGLNTSMAY
jgi:hypothetical protein